MEVPSSSRPRFATVASLVVISVLLLSCFRLAHIHLLWADEDYHLAAAINLLHGRVPYRDFWYDKPPFTAIYYLLIGGFAGWPLRLLDAADILASCYVAYRFATAWWGRAEGYTATLLLAFFTTFYLPSATIPFAADAVMLLPHLLAVYCAYRRQPIWAGIISGIAFLANTKALFVLAACGLFLTQSLLMLMSAFLGTAALGLLALLAEGAWPGYVDQVWRWGVAYTRGSPVLHPWINGLTRTLNWLGFHSALAIGEALSLTQVARRDRWRLGGWLALSFLGVSLGGRFAPHYFLQILPPLVLGASRGMVWAAHRYGRPAIFVLVAALALPLGRFGPRYVALAWDEWRGQPLVWIDIAMDLDSQAAAQQIQSLAKPGDTLLVWGYRPDIYVWTRMVSDSRFWDSQPLTGVPADRHLSATTAIYAGAARLNRLELTHSHPTWIVDGLGLMNPKLAIGSFQDLQPWLDDYRLVRRTKLSLIYRRIR